MQTRIRVANRKEADLIRRGLSDANTRAYVKVVGALSKLPTEWAKVRTLNFVRDFLREKEAMKQED